MSLVLFGAFDFVTMLLGIGLFLVSLFLILLVLVQRGKGGGLTGALGGMGGQSAFGTKAGDVFTKFTVGSAIVWILLCLLTIQLKNRPPQVVQEEDAVVESGMGTSSDDDSSLDAESTDDSVPDTDGDAKKDVPAKEEATKVEPKVEPETKSEAKKDDGKDGTTKADEKSADPTDSE